MKKMHVVITLLVLASLALSACGGAASSTFKVAEVTDTGGIDDKSFNAGAYQGIEKAIADLRKQSSAERSPPDIPSSPWWSRRISPLSR